jgi:hypothetical protein
MFIIVQRDISIFKWKQICSTDGDNNSSILLNSIKKFLFDGLYKENSNGSNIGPIL